MTHLANPFRNHVFKEWGAHRQRPRIYNHNVLWGTWNTWQNSTLWMSNLHHLCGWTKATQLTRLNTDNPNLYPALRHEGQHCTSSNSNESPPAQLRIPFDSHNTELHQNHATRDCAVGCWLVPTPDYSPFLQNLAHYVVKPRARLYGNSWIMPRVVVFKGELIHTRI
jgi:hypothetical protein